MSRDRSPSRGKKGGGAKKRRTFAAKDDDAKVYVGGLPHDSNTELLRRNFESFGRVKDCIVITDRVTGRSRGFGYVTFDDVKTVDEVLDQREVLVEGKRVTVKKAVAEQNMSKDATNFSANKIFVGGLPPSCDLEMLQDFFSKFGDVQDAVVMVDHQTQRTRGFGYVTFKSNQTVDRVLDNFDNNTIDGKWVEVKRCIPQDKMTKNDNNYNRGKGRRDHHDDRGPGDSSSSYGSYPPPPNGYPGYPGYGGYPGMPPPGYGYPGYGYPPMYPYGYPGYGVHPAMAAYAGYGYGPPPGYGDYGPGGPGPSHPALGDRSRSRSRSGSRSGSGSRKGSPPDKKKKRRRKVSKKKVSSSPSRSPSL